MYEPPGRRGDTPTGGASGTEAAEEEGTSGTDTPWGESANAKYGTNAQRGKTAEGQVEPTRRASGRRPVAGRDHPRISNPGRSIHGLFLATANPAGLCRFRTPAELDASIQNGAANPAAAGCRVYTAAAAEAARRWG